MKLNYSPLSFNQYASVLIFVLISSLSNVGSAQTVSAFDLGSVNEPIFPLSKQKVYGIAMSSIGGDATLTDLTTQATLGTYVGSDVSSFSLYYNDINDFGSATFLSFSSSTSFGAGEIISFNGFSQTIVGDGVNRYFYIAANLNAGATIGNTISIPFFALGNFTFSTTVSFTSSLGPSGTKTIQAVVAPTISSFTPTSAGSGNLITINGTGFIGVTDVSFGGTPATSFNVTSSTTLTAIVGAGTSGTISVVAAGGTATSAGFTFVLPPTISSINPTAAGTGTTVTITGTNLSGTTDVLFGATAAASFTVVSSTTITAVVANGSTGAVTVKSPAGGASIAGFTFLLPPMVVAFNPTSSAQGGSVTIDGTNFVNVTSVSFGGVPAESFVVVSSKTITAKVGVGASGSVSVTTSGGAASQPNFKFLDPKPLVKIGTSTTGTLVTNSSSSVIDLGKTTRTKDLTKEFIVENAGTSVLTILNVASSNSKISLVTAPSTLIPSEIGKLIFKLDANDAGVFSSLIEISFVGTLYQFELKGEVLGENPELEIFNIVTPNGDGAHDFLKLSNIEAYPSSNVSIFNRWGDKVYSISQYNNSESGKRFEGVSNEGEQRTLNEGTYYYVIELGSRKISGFLLLSR
jgi:gliding motility-associated-like protein